jgi:hypothetical protein
MADDPVRSYLEARAAFDAAKDKAQGMVDACRRIVSMLDRWEGVSFSNVRGVGFPPGLALINADDWPSVQALAQAITDYHQARAAMREAWDHVPDDLLSGLQPPPQK